MKSALFLLAPVLLLTFLAACGADPTPTPTRTATRGATATVPAASPSPSPSPSPTAMPTGSPAAGGATVMVELGDFFVRANPATAKAGQVAFQATNSGALPHELVVIKTDTDPASLPVSAGAVYEAAAGQKIGEIPESQLPGKGQAQASFALTTGKYVLICNIPGHYQAGMYTGFQAQ
ncbi:MAG: hypothetical protein FJ320_12775 [SAR202 cluster bacterium]|nr:hypothetical protein [SAR202 cluster bacterium]